MSTLYYFKAELPSNGFDTNSAKKVAANQEWEMACYQIEKGLGFHNKMRQHKENVVNTQVVAYFYQDWLDSGKQHRQCECVPHDYVLQDGDKLILFRQALPRNVPLHIPRQIRQQQEAVDDLLERANREQKWQELSEDDRIADMLTLDSKKTNFSGVSVRSQKGSSIQGIPPPSYICHRCMKPGHFKQQCPTLEDASFVPMDRRRRTTGIPSSMLRKAKPDEYGWAWIHSDGSLMVPLANFYS